MAREDPQMKIRLPESLKAEIEAQSRASGRTMNAEIVARLEGSFQPHPAEAQIMDYRNAALAQASIITMQGAFIAMLSDLVPPDNPQATKLVAIGKAFRTPADRKSAAWGGEAVKRLAEYGAKLRVDELDKDIFGKALMEFLDPDPEAREYFLHPGAKLPTKPTRKRAAAKKS